MRTTTEQAELALAYLAQSWPTLLELKHPGTPRRWTETVRWSEMPAELGAPAPATPSPAVLSVLDLTARVVDVVGDVARTVQDVLEQHDPQHNTPPGRPAESVMLDPLPWIRFVARHLRSADFADARTGPWALDRLERVQREVARLLGDSQQVGQTLNAVCPWCRGRSERRPTGGARTLMVVVPEPEDDEEPLIVCVGVNCDPPPSACSRRDRYGQPAWGEREWDWLARQVLPVEAGER